MLKAIFLNGTETNFDRIYDEESQALIRENFDFSETLYTKEKLTPGMDTEVIFSTWGMPVFTAEEIDLFFPNLKVVFYGAGTVQAFARPFLEKGIIVTSSWVANGIPVAEYSASIIMLANKGFFRMCAAERSYDGYIEARIGVHKDGYQGNYNTKVGLIGAGAIGSETARILNRTFVTDVYVFDPFMSEERAKELGVTKTSLEYIFENCQVISNHLANNPQTVNMLNYDLFKRMSPVATFVNTGRGAQVVEADLIRALKEVPTRVAVLDVTAPEPPLEDSEFYAMPNVILTPHAAGSMGREVKRMGKYAVAEAMRYIKGEELEYSVTLKMLETMA